MCGRTVDYVMSQHSCSTLAKTDPAWFCPEELKCKANQCFLSAYIAWRTAWRPQTGTFAHFLLFQSSLPLHRVLSSITFACLFHIISSAMCRRTTSANITFNQWSACSFSDGVGKSGLFSALYYVINRMIYDHDVDAFMAVRHVQTVCPHSVASLVSQICFCFKKSIL